VGVGLGVGVRGVRLDADGLSVAGRRVPIGSDGELVPSYLDVDEFEHRTMSLRPFLRAAQAGRPLAGISPGDRILILPNALTGSTDFTATPRGVMPSGYVVASVMSSAATGNWPHPVHLGHAALAACGLLGALLALALDTAWFALALVLLALLMPIAGIAAFAWAGVVTGWSLPTMTFVLSGIATHLERNRRTEARLTQLRNALTGLLPPERLQQLLEHPDQVTFSPNERVLTLMFIDVVGFSAVAEAQTPEVAFRTIKALVGRIAATVHAFDGVVDRTLGDGLLCYFGHDFGHGDGSRGDGHSSATHADQAVRCALAVQRDNLERMLAADASGEPVFPLRIGVNSAAVFVGDLGDARRIDFTLIGAGVNLGQRLEAACEPNFVLLGSATQALLTDPAHLGSASRRKLVKVKHQAHPLEAFEIDPHAGQRARLGAALAAYRRFAKLERLEDRWPLVADRVQLVSPFGPGRVVNVSRGGLAVELEVYLATGVELTVELPIAGDYFPTLLAEVRWSRPCPNGYLHGLHVKNLTGTQRDQLLKFLREAARHGEQPVA
jgi:class 3 adenylate cyclase